ncbi:MAG: phenylalanine--tRNA ligase subunit beta [Leptospirales bacterium]|nr:phenylalanine--tRNA ligase subunit beta [Leptospirales bacterium]
MQRPLHDAEAAAHYNMKLSWNWLNDYVDLSDVGPEKTAARLTLAVCEVDSVESIFAHLKSVVAVRVESVERHPEADRLSICQVSAGKERLQIVCGAANVRAGMLAALAPAGATLPGKEGVAIAIKTSRIRGVESRGMLCSAQELGLDRLFGETDGLLDLELCCKQQELKAPTPGKDLAAVLCLEDTVLDIDNKSITHRPDLWCHFGFAREIAALFHKPLRFDPLAAQKPKRPTASSKSGVKRIEIEEGAAHAYFGMYVDGVSVKPSPFWMQARLLAVGQKPINNVVDASNYAMFELGQPNHAFDASLLRNDSVLVASASRARDLKNFTALDGVERALPPEAIIIFDGKASAKTAVAIGGIIGGLHSGIAPQTTRLFLESACFPRERIRAAISALALRTDSAQRFEKGQDPSKAAPALGRIVELLRHSCPDLQPGALSGAGPQKERRNRIRLRLSFLQARLGFAISAKQAVDTLRRLHFEVKALAGKDPELQLLAPAFRSQYDITIAEDIVEELGRVFGYDNIAPRAPQAPVQALKPNRDRSLARKLRLLLAAAGGYSEVYNYSFSATEDNLIVGRRGLQLQNPVFGDRPELRVSQIPGILRQAAQNENRFPEFKIFEFGRVFLKDGRAANKARLAEEERRITLLYSLPDRNDSDLPLDQQNDFVQWNEMRLLLDRLSAECGVALQCAIVERPQDAAPYLHPGCAISLHASSGELLGYAGILHPVFQDRFDLRRRCLIADLHFDAFLTAHLLERKKRAYSPPSIFPDSAFELSLLLDEKTGSEVPLQVLRQLALPELRSMRLLAIYRGAPLPAAKKSVSYELRALKQDGTLSGEELQMLLERCVAALAAAGFPLR